MNLDFLNNVIDFILQWYWISVTIIFILVLATILIENRNPTKTIAWVMVIVFLPIVGIVIYFFFGQKFNKIRKFNKSERKERKLLMQIWNKNNENIKARINDLKSDIGSLTDVYELLNNQHISPLTPNNEVILLNNGEEKFKHLLNDIKNAKHHIHIEYYIFLDDEIGNQIVNALIEKSKEGVHIRVILDDFGSPTSKFKKRFKDNGIEYHVFLPVKINSLANSNYRNHRKIVIIDANISYVGGINVSDKYINSSTNNLYWRDTALKIIGPATSILQIYFWNHWNFEDTQTKYLDEDYFPKENLFNKSSKPNDADISFTLSNPGYDSPFAMDSIILAIYKAEKSIQICTPYFIPTEQLITALQTAAMRGVNVEIILPKKSDSKIVQLASISFTKPLLKKGVKIYLYKKGFLHAKTISIDNKLNFIGTVNLDTRSFYLNFEIAAIVVNKKLSTQMKKEFENDITNSELLTINQYLKKGVFYRSAASVCRLLSPIL